MTDEDKSGAEDAKADAKADAKTDAKTGNKSGNKSGLSALINSEQPDYTKSTERVTMTDAERLAQKKRNTAIGWALVGFMVLIFTITVLRLSANIAGGAS